MNSGQGNQFAAASITQHSRINDATGNAQAGSVSFRGEVHAKTEAVKDGRPNVEKGTRRCRSIGDFVAIVEQVLGGSEDLQVVREILSDLQIHGVEPAQWILVLIIVKLVPDKASLHT